MNAFFVYIPRGFVISVHGESYFPNGLEFPRAAKVVSRKVWRSRARRKSFPEWFGISAHGESCFPNGLTLAGLPQITFKRILRLRASRKSLLRVLTLRYKAKFNQQKFFENKRKKYQHK